MTLHVYYFCLRTTLNWGLWRQEQVSQSRMNNYTPQYYVGYNSLSLSEMPASGTEVIQLLIHAITDVLHFPHDFVGQNSVHRLTTDFS